jgi:hypothetical protein
VELASRLLSRDAAEDERAEATARLLLSFDNPAIKYVFLSLRSSSNLD